jgi:hypothetical protein
MSVDTSHYTLLLLLLLLLLNPAYIAGFSTSNGLENCLLWRPLHQIRPTSHE